MRVSSTSRRSAHAAARLPAADGKEQKSENEASRRRRTSWRFGHWDLPALASYLWAAPYPARPPRLQSTLTRSGARAGGPSLHEHRGAALARVAAHLVLISVVHHELDPVHVPLLDRPCREQRVHVPRDLGAVALVGEPRRGGVAAVQVVIVLGRIGVRCHRDGWRVPRVVERPDRPLPRAEDRVRRNRG